MDEEMLEISIEGLEFRPDDTPRPKSDGETNQEMLVEDPTRTIAIGTGMDSEVRVKLVTLLRENTDIFAFATGEMSGIDLTVMVHHLNVDIVVRPIKQKKRSFSIGKTKPSKMK